ncbi:glycoside hydrolase family 3 protein [Mesoplasma florum]|uniref:glycoside hydrolase family 3 protein n=1 Tax=Mesoplasma florum TaxID=2151 RepID=UPI000D034A81|nr:glycoside hydrolase family 3 protein [Mesoplasma florum]AVN58931.1 hypothetical protein CG009_01660 [Mesoplasma florum]
MLSNIELKKIIKNMTIEEKIGQINQPHFGWQIWFKENNEIYLTNEFKDFIKKFGGVGSIYGVLRTDPWTKKNFENSFINENEQRIVINKIKEYVIQNTRLKIPPLFSEEVTHGILTLFSNVLPTNISIGSSFDKEKFKIVLKYLRKELISKGINLALFSGLDIPKDKRWGRTEECFGEDPFLAAIFNNLLVKTIQKDNNVSVCLKHFVAYGSSEEGKNGLNSIIGNNELKEIHIKPALGAIKAGVDFMMVAYNEIDGIPCIVNKELLTNLLRKKLKYKGALMADGFAIDAMTGYICKNDYESASMALNAGVDISLWDKSFINLEQAINKNLIKMSQLDESVHRILSIKNKLGLFDKNKNYNVFEFDKFKENYKKNIIELAASASVVLKNENSLLPIKNPDKIKKVLLISRNDYDIYDQLGDYTSFQNKTESILDGVLKFFKNQNICIEQSNFNVKNDFIKKYDLVIVISGDSSKRNFDAEFLENGALKTSKIKTMTSGEGVDEIDLNLRIEEKYFFENVKHDKIITILTLAKPRIITDVVNKSKSILNIGYPGNYGNELIFKLLEGSLEPSGRLNHTFPIRENLNSLTYNNKNVKDYKYFNNDSEILFEFGYGLGYGEPTKIKILSLDLNKAYISIKNNTNINKVETLLIFGKKEFCLPTPRKSELVDFKKIRLKPFEEKKITVKFNNVFEKYNDLNSSIWIFNGINKIKVK